MKEVRDKVLDWLKEENLEPEQVEMPNQHWAFRIKVWGTGLFVSQNTRQNDSIAVWGAWTITEKDRNLLKRLDEKKENGILLGT